MDAECDIPPHYSSMRRELAIFEPFPLVTNIAGFKFRILHPKETKLSFSKSSYQLGLCT